MKWYPAQVRFIPACAGNRSRLRPIISIPPVHPRVCGEQNKRINGVPPYIGSSPRVRGTGFAQNPLVEFDRFIPACAGNRPFFWSISRSQSVHPRVCGEQEVATVLILRPRGSSPRVRGTAEQCVKIADIVRFIPACAGNSPGSSGSST